MAKHAGCLESITMDERRESIIMDERRELLRRSTMEQITPTWIWELISRSV